MEDELSAYLQHIDRLRALPVAARQIRYEERVFAFIDVLGWSKLIADSVCDRTAMRVTRGRPVDASRRYKLTGSWNAPVVERIEGTPAPQDATKPSAKP